MRTLNSFSLHLHKVQKNYSEDVARVQVLRDVCGLAKLTPQQLKDERQWIWLIVDQKTGHDLGAISLVPFGEGEWELGFVLKPEVRREGILSAVLPAFVRSMGLPLYSETSTKDFTYRRVLENSGFEPCASAHEFQLGFRFKPAS